MHESEPHASCGAKTRDGDPCKNPPMRGRKRCRMHGGKSTGAPIKDGRRSVSWAARMAAKVEAARNDPSIFNQQQRAAALHAQYTDLEQRWLDWDEEPAELWKEAQAAFKRAKTALAAKEFAKCAAALEELEQILNNGSGHDHLFGQMQDLAKLMADISRVQQQGLKNASDILTAREQELFKVRVITELRAIPRPLEPAELERYEQHFRLFLAAFLKAAG